MAEAIAAEGAVWAEAAALNSAEGADFEARAALEKTLEPLPKPGAEAGWIPMEKMGWFLTAGAAGVKVAWDQHLAVETV